MCAWGQIISINNITITLQRILDKKDICLYVYMLLLILYPYITQILYVTCASLPDLQLG